MTSRSEELEQFKREIDLRLLAADFGFQVDARASSASGTVMRAADGSKIRISKDTDHHFVYWNAHDPADSGSVIDFVQHRTGCNLGEARKTLRPWVGRAPSSTTQPSSLPQLEPIARDIAAVQAQFEGMRPLESGRHRYLNDERGLPADLLAHPRFADRVRVDERSNAVFPHLNRSGVCGFELKNTDWTGFSKAGAKGLWCSGVRADDHRLVVCESAIDALSYAAVNGFERTRFVSLAGQVSDEQVDLVRAAIAKLPSGEVVLGFDRDEAGDRLVERFSAVFEESGRTDLALRVGQPAASSCDWNDVLRAKSVDDLAPPLL